MTHIRNGLKFWHDDNSVEEFIRRLAKANIYRTHDAGEVIDAYWREEAVEWAKELEQSPWQGLRPDSKVGSSV